MKKGVVLDSRPQFHHIQRGIILSLVSKSPARFTELQPPRVPNNTFSYHLKKLVDAGYIEVVPEGYVATRKALKLVLFDTSKHRHRATPATISILFIRNKAGEVLLLNRNNKPFQGWYGLPSGIIHTGETLQNAAKRELYEKTTIKLDDAEHLQEVGVLDFRYIHKDTNDIFVHAIAFVYEYTLTDNVDVLSDKQTKYGQLSWSTLSRKYILPEVFAVSDMAASKSTAYTSVDFKEPNHLPVFVGGV